MFELIIDYIKENFEESVAVATLFFISTAALASRKQNILKTAPLITLKYESASRDSEGGIVALNLSNKFARSLKTETFYLFNESKGNELESGINKILLLGYPPNHFNGNNNAMIPMMMSLNSKWIQKDVSDFYSFIYERYSAKVNGVYLFYKDVQGHRFAIKLMGISSELKETYNLITSESEFKIVGGPYFVPSYNLVFWAYYASRTIKTWIFNLLYFLKAKLRRWLLVD